jgi:tetratricopeptide (TPR) repeat protein
MAGNDIPSPEASRAVLIGVSEHDDPGIPSYTALERGAVRLASLLQEPKVWGLSEEHCTVLTGSKATRENISRALLRAAREASDTLIVYYGGHGRWNRRRHPARLSLAHREASHAHNFDWLDFEWLRGHLERSACPNTRHRMLLLDSCHSGVAMEHGKLSSDAAENWAEEDRDDLSTLLTSCDRSEEANVPDGAQYSAFMAALIEVLDSGVEGAGATLTPTDLKLAVRARLGGTQTPRLLCADGAGSQPLFWNRAREREIEAPDSKSTIPLPPGILFGRDQLVSRLLQGARAAVSAHEPYVAVLHGRGGYGKSALASRVATELRTDFPQWQFYVNLHSWTPGQPRRTSENLLEELLYQAGQPNIPQGLSAREGRWRRWLADNQALIILDDAADADQVRSVLPPLGARCAVILTSRQALGHLNVTWSAEVGPLTESSAVELLGHDIQDPPEAAELAALAKAVSYVPKALTGLAKQISGIPADLLLKRVRNSGSDAMAELYRNSLAKIDSEPRRLTALMCGIHPGPDFDAHSIAAMLRTDPSETAQHLHSLAQDRMLEPLRHYRFRLHDEDVQIARVIAEDGLPDSGSSATWLLLDWLAKRADAGISEFMGHRPPTGDSPQPIRFENPGAAMKWFRSAERELLTGVAAALKSTHPNSRTLALSLAAWSRMVGRYDMTISICSSMNQRGTLAMKAAAKLGLGWVSMDQNHWKDAESHFRSALHYSQMDNDVTSASNAWLGFAQLALMRHEKEEATRYAHGVLKMAQTNRDPVVEANALGVLGHSAHEMGDFEQARSHFERALDISHSSGALLTEADVVWGMGRIAQAHGKWEEAKLYFGFSLDLAQLLENRSTQINALRGLGNINRKLGRLEESEAQIRSSITIAESTENLVPLAEGWRSLAVTLMIQGRKPEAAHAFREAISRYKILGWSHWVEYCHQFIAEL